MVGAEELFLDGQRLLISVNRLGSGAGDGAEHDQRISDAEVLLAEQTSLDSQRFFEEFFGLRFFPVVAIEHGQADQIICRFQAVLAQELAADRQGALVVFVSAFVVALALEHVGDALHAGGDLGAVRAEQRLAYL